jgi:hypothetical protein
MLGYLKAKSLFPICFENIKFFSKFMVDMRSIEWKLKLGRIEISNGEVNSENLLVA